MADRFLSRMAGSEQILFGLGDKDMYRVVLARRWRDYLGAAAFAAARLTKVRSLETRR